MAGIAQKLRARQRPPVPARVDLIGLRHPTETPANALAHRQLNNALAIAARAHARGRLLDVGCGEKPYAPLLRDLILSTPFMWPLHEEPRDFFRYSPHGLRHLLKGSTP